MLLEILFQSFPWLAQLQNSTVQPLPLRDEEAHGSRPAQGCFVSFVTMSLTCLQGQKSVWLLGRWWSRVPSPTSGAGYYQNWPLPSNPPWRIPGTAASFPYPRAHVHLVASLCSPFPSPSPRGPRLSFCRAKAVSQHLRIPEALHLVGTQ